MKITFLGSGEAFDHKQPNTSMVLEMNRVAMLLDAGHSVFTEVWKHNLDPNYLSAIYISHMHGDHIFGLPAIIKRMVEEKREKKLSIIVAESEINLLKQVMDLGYRNLFNKTPFELEFIGVNENQSTDFLGLKLSFAETQHSVKNLAIKVEDGDKIFCYSGDGNHTVASVKLFRNADLLVHDGYYFDREINGHDNMVSIYEFSKKIGVKKIAFTHVQRDERVNLEVLKKIGQFEVESFIPEKGQSLKI